jgi:DNA primase
MSWDYNFSFPEDNNLQSPNDNIRYIVRTTAVKWWDRYTYDDIITKINKLCTEQFLASNQFLVKKNINQAKLASSSSKHEFKKHMLETLSQLSDDEDEDESVLPRYAQDPYVDSQIPIQI